MARNSAATPRALSGRAREPGTSHAARSGCTLYRPPIERSFDPIAHMTVDFNNRGNVMSRLTACVKIATLVCAGLATFLTTTSTFAFDRNKAQLFAVLPAGSTLPE